MNTWKIVKIKDYPIVIIDGDRGANYPQKEEFSDSGFCLFLNTGNVTNSGFIFENKSFITKEKDKLLRKGKLERFDIVLTTRGTIGNIGFYSNSVLFENIRINSGMLILRPKIDELEPSFFYLLMKSDIFQQQANLFQYGSAQPQLPVGTLNHIKLPLPPLPIQKKIAAILSAYDDLIENNLKQIRLLEEMAQITYQEWFVRLKFPNHENTPIDETTGLPIGWSEEAITAISFINANSLSTKTAPETIKYIDIASAGTGFYAEPEILNFSEAPSRARRKVNFGDTIFSTVRPNQKTYSLILENDPLLVSSTGFAVVTPKITDTFPFVYLSVAHQNFVDKAVSVAGGAAYPAINQNDFEKIKIIKPDDELIKQFSEKVINNFIIKGNLTKQNQRLKEARDILLPRLMTGKITVDDL